VRLSLFQSWAAAGEQVNVTRAAAPALSLWHVECRIAWGEHTTRHFLNGAGYEP
jgi:hypothetical protein